MSFEIITPIVSQEFNGKDEVLITKLASYGIKNIDLIYKIKLEFEKSNPQENNEPAELLERIIHSNFTQNRIEEESKLIIQTVAIYLEKDKEINPDKFTGECIHLENLLSPDMKVGRMVPKPINFKINTDNWEKFDPATTTFMIICWAVIYSIIIYYFYL